MGSLALEAAEEGVPEQEGPGKLLAGTEANLGEANKMLLPCRGM